MIDDTPQTNNYKQHLSHNIRQVINDMTDERKRHLLDDIQLKRRCCSLLGQNYDTNVCQYIESLLQNNRPTTNLVRRSQ